MPPRKRKPRRTPRVQAFFAEHLGSYDVTTFREDTLYRDKVTSTLGASMGGWIPELVYRYAIDSSTGLNVDWAIMLYARRASEGSNAQRRRVERIDICESEVHVHRFRFSDDPDDDQGERKKLAALYAGDVATVSQYYDLQMALLSREWPFRMQRWIDG